MVMLSASALLLVACGGGSNDAKSPSSGDATTTSTSTSVDDKTVTFVDRARLETTSTFNVVSCSRPDPLGLQLVAKGTEGTLTIKAANGVGTYKLSSQKSAVPVRVSAGPDGALFVDVVVDRATVTCGE